MGMNQSKIARFERRGGYNYGQWLDAIGKVRTYKSEVKQSAAILLQLSLLKINLRTDYFTPSIQELGDGYTRDGNDSVRIMPKVRKTLGHATADNYCTLLDSIARIGLQFEATNSPTAWLQLSHTSPDSGTCYRAGSMYRHAPLTLATGEGARVFYLRGDDGRLVARAFGYVRATNWGLTNVYCTRALSFRAAHTAFVESLVKFTGKQPCERIRDFVSCGCYFNSIEWARCTEDLFDMQTQIEYTKQD